MCPSNSVGDTLRPRWSRTPPDTWWAGLWFPGRAERGMEFLPCIPETLHGPCNCPCTHTALPSPLHWAHEPAPSRVTAASNLLGTCSKCPVGEGQSIKLVLLYFSCTSARIGPKQIKVKTEGVLGKMCLLCSITCTMEMMFPTLPWPTER